MKTIVEIATNLSKYLLEDADAVTMRVADIVVGNPPAFIIADMNSSTAVVYEGITPPADWTGDKYTFDGANWAVNLNWVAPQEVPPALN